MNLPTFIHIAHAAAETATEANSGGVIALLGLNWKLFIAQLVNFAIVVFILWRWVFKPVTKGLEARTAKIEGSLAEARRIAEEKETFDSWKTGEISKIRKEAGNILEEAKKDALALKNGTLAETKKEQDRILQQIQSQITSEQDKAVKEIKLHVAELVADATEKVIKIKLTEAKDKELIEEALKSVLQIVK